MEDESRRRRRRATSESFSIEDVKFANPSPNAIPVAHSPSTSIPQVVTFDYSCRPVYNFWLVPEDTPSAEPELVRSYEFSVLKKPVTFDLSKPIPGSILMKQMIRDLRVFPASTNTKAELILQTMSAALQLYQNKPSRKAFTTFNIECTIIHDYFLVNDRFLAPEDEFEEFFVDSIKMTPASKSSVECLESKIVDWGGQCTICLEDYEEGFRGLSLPCEHIFHDDCIKNWLYTSHYCPLCRFEMPIDCTHTG